MRNLSFCAIIALCLAVSSCGTSHPTSVNISPAAADAKIFPGGLVQFSAIGSNGMPLQNVTWCIGTMNGVCNGNIASIASVDSKGVAQCLPGLTGTAIVLAGSAGQPGLPDTGFPLHPFGFARLTCP